MSEEEIIKEINIIKETVVDIFEYDLTKYTEDIYKLDTKQVSALLGLLDLYYKLQKENEELENENFNLKEKEIINKYIVPEEKIFYNYYSIDTNNEEKKAIEKLKNRQGFRFDSKCVRCGKGASIMIPPEALYGKEIDIILNCIDKQQKIINKQSYTNKKMRRTLKTVRKERNKLQKEIERIKSIDIHKLVEDAETGQLIHKDKIKELREIDNIDHLQFKIKELLGE